MNAPATSNGEALLVVRDLVKHFPIRRGVFQRTVGAVRAVDGVSFSIVRGETLALVGESGCGKSTTGRCILRLIEPTAGAVHFEGRDLLALGKREMRHVRKRIQPVFQDPYGSLNPRITVYGMLGEILAVHRIARGAALRDRVFELLELVGLVPESADRYPHEFSGGQRQRIGVARAVATNPDLIIADEPVSALDVSVQAQILNLLEELQERLALSYLFISHDLGVVRHIADSVAVMYLGRIVEIGAVEAIFERHAHPYTRALLSAVPVPDPGAPRRRIILSGDVPNPAKPPSGCPFHPRCPDAEPRCRTEAQRLVEVAPGHAVACHVHAPQQFRGQTTNSSTHA